MRKSILSLFVIFLPVFAAANDLPDPYKPYGGTLTWGVCTKPTIINPVLTTHSISMSLLDLIFNRLVRLNPKGEIEPDLARSWDISSDGLVYTFHLRRGVRFHDGVECTACDVYYTFNKLIDPRVRSPFASSFELVKEFKAIDKWTFQVILKKPSVTFIYRLTREILPKHLIERAEPQNWNFNRHPVGTGPFRFKEWTNDQITLEYNPDYYEGRPYLDKIIVKVYPSSQDVWVALMRQEVDYAGFIERQDYDIVREDPTFRTYTFPIDHYYAIFYNPDDPILADKRIRQAIAYAIDRKALIDQVAFGYGIESNGPFYPGSMGFNPKVIPCEYDPGKSSELLAKAGWKDENEDGILVKNGEDLELRILVDSRIDTLRRIAMFIRQELQGIGIKLKVQAYNDDKELTDGFLEQNKSQAQLKEFFAGGSSDEVRYHWAYKRSHRQKVNKLWIYRNAKVEKLFELGENAQDKNEAKIIYQKVHQLIYADQPACFLYFPFDLHALSARFENADDFFNMNMPVYTIKDWYVKKTRVLANKGHK